MNNKNKGKKRQLGRPSGRSGRGRAIVLYMAPDVEKELREKSESEGRSMSAVVADAVMGKDVE